MNPVYTIWSAVLADLAVLLDPWVLRADALTFGLLVLLHGLISGVAAVGTHALLPPRFRQPKGWTVALLAAFAFSAPVVGALGLLLLVRVYLVRPPKESVRAVPKPLGLPVYEAQSRDVARTGQGAIRSRLNADAPAPLRMQSLLTLQAVPNRVANPILESLLGDDSDDVRLVAFGMLDAQEKRISGQIRAELERLQANPSAQQRYAALRHLAELNWELVYAGLAQGGLRAHLLRESLRCADEALAVGLETPPALHFLRARVLFEQRNFEPARLAFEQALALGQPKASVLPYLAEIAFESREFAQVRSLMTDLASLNLASNTRAVEDYWVHRTEDPQLHDRRYLPHI